MESSWIKEWEFSQVLWLSILNLNLLDIHHTGDFSLCQVSNGEEPKQIISFNCITLYAHCSAHSSPSTYERYCHRFGDQSFHESRLAFWRGRSSLLRYSVGTHDVISWYDHCEFLCEFCRGRGGGQRWMHEVKGNTIIIIIIIIKARLQPRLESYKLYTQGHQQGKQSSKEKENK